jgi:hypothetical protein
VRLAVDTDEPAVGGDNRGVEVAAALLLDHPEDQGLRHTFQSPQHLREPAGAQLQGVVSHVRRFDQVALQETLREQ